MPKVPSFVILSLFAVICSQGSKAHAVPPGPSISVAINGVITGGKPVSVTVTISNSGLAPGSTVVVDLSLDNTTTGGQSPATTIVTIGANGSGSATVNITAPAGQTGNNAVLTGEATISGNTIKNSANQVYGAKP